MQKTVILFIEFILGAKKQMSERHNRILKSSFAVAIATLLSRILGLARVVLESAVLGGGTTASAWHLAFMWPNLFRRLLGEGALGTALIPLITHSEADHGRTVMRQDLAIIFSILSVILVIICIAVSLVAMALDCYGAFAEYVHLALKLLPILMPYMIFICLVGVIGAVLNTQKVFFLPALGALSLNIFLISGLLFLNGLDISILLENLSLLVVASGIIQLILMVLLLWQQRVFPIFSKNFFKRTQPLKELWRLTLPGLIGYSALQISFIVDRLLAASLGEYAVPALVYTERIIDLPIGIFAISLGSVLMANMSQAAAKNDHNELQNDLTFGLKQVMFISIPMTFFVIFFRSPILDILLMRGNFSTTALNHSIDTALYMALGIPTFCAIKIILPAFYARKEMKKPLIVSLCCIVINIILNLILMVPLKQSGIALATVISSIINTFTLLFLLRKDGITFPVSPILTTFLRTIIAGGIASCTMLFYHRLIFAGAYIQLFLGWAIFSIIYLVVSIIMQGDELNDFIQIFIKRKRKTV